MLRKIRLRSSSMNETTVVWGGSAVKRRRRQRLGSVEEFCPFKNSTREIKTISTPFPRSHTPLGGSHSCGVNILSTSYIFYTCVFYLNSRICWLAVDDTFLFNYFRSIHLFSRTPCPRGVVECKKKKTINHYNTQRF